MSENNQKNLNKLATEMVLNHLSVSLDSNLKDETKFENKAKEIISIKTKNYRQ